MQKHIGRSLPIGGGHNDRQALFISTECYHPPNKAVMVDCCRHHTLVLACRLPQGINIVQHQLWLQINNGITGKVPHIVLMNPCTKMKSHKILPGKNQPRLRLTTHPAEGMASLWQNWPVGGRTGLSYSSPAPPPSSIPPAS